MRELLSLTRDILFLASNAALTLLAANPGPYRARAIRILAQRAGGRALVEVCQDGSSTIHVRTEGSSFKIAL